jgi:hypothetical protein
VVKLVDTPDLGSGAARCEGSSPFLGNAPEDLFFKENIFGFFLFTESSFLSASNHLEITPVFLA